MNKQKLSKIADEANLIVNGYAMTIDNGLLRIINLHRPTSSAVFDSQERLIETSMDDIELSIVQEYVKRDRPYLEDSVA